MLIGLSFFAALGQLDSSSPRYAELTAGLIAIRLAHDALRLRTPGRNQIEAGRRSLAAALSVGPSAIRLRDVLNAVQLAEEGEEDANTIVSGRLLLYGIYLHERGEYDLASDVFEALLAAPLCDTDVRMQALLRRGFACRLGQRFVEAEMAYSELRRVARSVNDGVMSVEASYGLAKVVGQQGNIAEFERQMLALVPEAEATGNAELIEKTYIDRALVAGFRRRFVEALHYSYVALEGMRDERRRVRASANIAVALRELGEHDAAVSLCDRSISQPADDDVRTSILTTRYHLAIDANDWRYAKTLRAALRDIRQTPAGNVAYYEVVAREFASRNHFTVAKRLLERMVEHAKHACLGERVIWADAALADVEAGLVPVRYVFSPTPPSPENKREVRAIVSALTSREFAHAT